MTTRAALIEAAADAIFREEGPECIDDEGSAALAQVALDAVLPLIADAIEDPIRLGESVHYEFCSLAQAGALVRSYLDGKQ